MPIHTMRFVVTTCSIQLISNCVNTKIAPILVKVVTTCRSYKLLLQIAPCEWAFSRWKYFVTLKERRKNVKLHMQTFMMSHWLQNEKLQYNDSLYWFHFLLKYIIREDLLATLPCILHDSGMGFPQQLNQQKDIE